MKTKILLTSITGALTFGLPLCANAAENTDVVKLSIEKLDDNKNAVKLCHEWLDLLTKWKLKKSMELMKMPVLVGSRNERLKNGKPVAEELQYAITQDKIQIQQLLPAFAAHYETKNLKIKGDKSERITAKKALKISPLLEKVLPNGGYKVAIDPDGSLELYVNHEGKIVAMIEVKQ